MSDTNASFQADEPFFQALLIPHRSLGKTGFAILMGALLFGSLVTGAFFLSRGAWPVFGFLGLDVIAVYIAFRANYRAARAREEVSVSRTSLDIRKTAPSGKESENATAKNAEQLLERSISVMWAAANLEVVTSSVTAVTSSTSTLIKQQ